MFFVLCHPKSYKRTVLIPRMSETYIKTMEPIIVANGLYVEGTRISGQLTKKNIRNKSISLHIVDHTKDNSLRRDTVYLGELNKTSNFIIICFVFITEIDSTY